MGYSASQWSWISFVAAVCVCLVAYSFAWGLARKEMKPQTGINWMLWPILFLLFILVMGIITAQALRWALRFSGEIPSELAKANNKTLIDVLCESRSMLAGAQAVLLAACALFIPFLTSLWNNAKRILGGQIEKHVELHKNPPNPKQKDKLETAIASLARLREDLTDFSEDMRLPFQIGVAVTFGTVVVSGVSYIVRDVRVAYLAPPLLAAVGSVLFLWYLTLMIAYVAVVQRVLYRHDYVDFLL